MHRKKLVARKKAKNALRILHAARIRKIASMSVKKIRMLKVAKRLNQKLPRKVNINTSLSVKPPVWAALSFLPKPAIWKSHGYSPLPTISLT